MNNYVADFYCMELSLIIELDGDVHAIYKEKQEKDKIREKFLKKRCTRIIRYNNNDIYNNLESVMENLYSKCEKLINTKGGDS